MMLGILGTFALVLALVIPGGLLLRLFGIALVDRKGHEVTRWLSFRRAVVVWWAPLLLASGLSHLLLLAGRQGRPTVLILAPIVFAVSLCGAYLAGIAVALVNPQQGLQDYFLGNYLVPR
jgi:predicted exporter